MLRRWADVLARARGRRAAGGGHRRAPGCPSGCSAVRTASGGSPTCGTSAQALHAAAVDGHARPGRAGRVAAPPHRRGRRRTCGRGAQPAARVRRRRRAGRHRAPQQGPGVPRRVRAVRLGPLRAARAGRTPAARRRRRPGAGRRRGGRAAVVASTAPRHEAEEAGEDLRLLYVALTRAHVPGRGVVGARDDDADVAAAPAAVRPPGSGGDAARVVRRSRTTPRR